MKTQTLGDVSVSRVVEMEGHLFEASVLLPDSRVEDFKAHADWLAPHFFDMAAEQMLMSIHTFIVRTPSHTILIDTCCGNHKNRPAREAFHMLDGNFLADLAAAGVAPEAVDYVMCTHLHFDHVGWNTRLEDGNWVPTFPNAKYLFSRTDWEAFQEMPADGPHLHAYRDSVIPVVEAGQAVMVETDYGLDDSIWLEPSPGHTPGHYSVRLASKGRQGVFFGDLMHHPVQCAHPEWSSRACLDPDQSRATRLAFLDAYAETNVTVFSAHFATPTHGRVVGNGDGCRFQVGE